MTGRGPRAAAGIDGSPNAMAEKPQGDARELTRRIVTLFAPYRTRVIGIAALVIVAAVLGIVNPLLTKTIFDQGLFPADGSGVQLHIVLVIVGAMIGIAAIGAGIQVWQQWLANTLGQQVMLDLRVRLFGHLQAMSLKFFTATRTGEIQSRVTNDVAGVQNVVTTTATSILGTIVTIISAVVAMLILSWQLTLVALIVLPLFFWLTRVVGDRRRKVVSSTQRTVADITALTEESLSVSGVLLAKVFHRQAQDLDKFSRENSRLAELNVRQNMIGQGFFAAIQAFLQVSPALIYLTAAFVLYRGGDITAGTVVAFTTLQTRLFFPLGNLLQTIVELRSSLAYFERIFDYLDLVPDITEAEHPISLDKATTEGRVDYDSVEFSYDEGANTLNGITLNVEPGKLLALVGPSGAGKTTIGYLLPRLYDVTGGSVKIDGVDVREMSFDSLASIVGMVSQESYLFHANIRDNLKYGNREATDEQVIAAAQAAAIHDRIMSFPSGYDTMVGERGYRLSGGEKQRVAIARVLLHNPKVLLLDEATSALDTTSERLVQGALTNAMAGRTTIAIAHRLSTIQAADSIAVIDAGRVVEQGTHDQLLARGGLYASLYREQFGDGSIEARCSDGILLRDGTIVPNDLNHPVTVGANPSPSAVE